MIKHFLIICTIILSLFATYEGNAQCPTGSTSITRFITIGGCQYRVVFCVQCSPSGGLSYLNVFGFSKVDQNCISTLPDETPGTILSEIKSYVENNVSFLRSLCSDLMPCEEGSALLFFGWYKCLQLHRTMSGEFQYWPCTSSFAYCQDVYRICIDDQGNLQKLQEPGYPSYGPEQPNCPLSYNQAVPNIFSIPLGGYSPCFFVPTPCD